MNQILVTKLNYNEIKNRKKFLSIFLISIIAIVGLSIYLIIENINKKEESKIAQLYVNLAKVQKVYDTEKLVSNENIFLGNLIIPKINLEYTIFNNFDEELLKISICKFFGTNLQEEGNICLVGHNYDDERFFGKIKNLEIGDKIIIEDLNGENYVYIVNDIFETSPDDISCIEYEEKYKKELTLVTCNNRNGKRVIVKSGIEQ